MIFLIIKFPIFKYIFPSSFAKDFFSIDIVREIKTGWVFVVRCSNLITSCVMFFITSSLTIFVKVQSFKNSLTIRIACYHTFPWVTGNFAHTFQRFRISFLFFSFYTLRLCSESFCNSHLSLCFSCFMFYVTHFG